MKVNYEFIGKLAEKRLSEKYTSAEASGVGYLPASVYEKLARLVMDDLPNLYADPLTKLEAQFILDGIVGRAKSELKYRYGRTLQEEELSEGDTANLDSFLNEFVQGR